MGLRIRKSVKIAPGVRLSVGKKSASVSFGGKGFRKTISTTGRKTTTYGTPLPGVSFVDTESAKKDSNTNKENGSGSRNDGKTLRWCLYFLAAILAAVLIYIAFFS